MRIGNRFRQQSAVITVAINPVSFDRADAAIDDNVNDMDILRMEFVCHTLCMTTEAKFTHSKRGRSNKKSNINLMLQIIRDGPTGGPIQQFHGVYDGYIRSACQLDKAANIAGRQNLRAAFRQHVINSTNPPVLQLPGHFRL